MQPPTIFISGSGRSGTNITKAILSRHSECAALAFEYRFTIDPRGIVDFINQYSSNWSPFLADHRLRDLESFLLSLADRNPHHYTANQWLRKINPSSNHLSRYPYAGWELEQSMPGFKQFISELMNDLVDYKYNASWPGTPPLLRNNAMYYGSPKKKSELIPLFSSFLSKCVSSFLDKEDKSTFVEDNTWSILFAEDLFQLLPKAKMLHIVRDPRDVIVSLLEQRWTPNSIAHLIPWYRDIMDAWNFQKAKLRKDQFLEVRLEDIIQDTSTTIEHICEFSHLRYEPEMIALDLSRSNMGRYKSALNIDQIALINDQLSDIISSYGYS